MEIKQQLRLSQQLVMTPQLQQAIRLLQLSRLELVDEVRKELDNNPVLSDEEPLERTRNTPGEVRTVSEHGAGEEREYPRNEVKATEKVTREVDWEKFLENRTQQQSPSPGGRSGFEDLPPIEQNLTKPGNIQDHLLWQLQMSDFSESERRFAELVIGNLDEKGYLDLAGIERPDGTRTPDLTIEDLAAEAELHLDDAPLVLEMIQAFDPIGVAARDLRECLLIQARVAGYEDGEPELEIIKNHLHHLEKHNYQAIVREMKISL
jgi:RNA polymerase sigma-54 factor